MDMLYALLSVVVAWLLQHYITYHKTSNISRTSVGDEIVDNSDVVEASPVGAAPTISYLHFQFNTWLKWIEGRQLQGDTRNI